MEKNYHKNLLGILGLSAVALMTAVAANIPAPVAATSSATDTITINVLDDLPSARITSPENNSEITSSLVTVEYDYHHLQSAKLILVFYDEDGNTVDTIVGEETFDVMAKPDGASGSSSFTFDLSDHTPASRYTVFLEGTGMNNEKVGSDINLLYYPITSDDTEISVDQDDNGDPVINLTDVSDDVAYITVTVTDENGNVIMVPNLETGEDEPYVRIFRAPISRLPIDFAASGITTSGTYRFEIRAFNNRDRQIGSTIIVTYELTVEIEVAHTPDTGSFLSNLNLAREDYAITGLMVFGGGLFLLALFLRRKQSKKH